MKISQFTIILILTAMNLFAQEKFYKIDYINASQLDVKSEVGQIDSAGLVLKVNQIRNLLMTKGYLLANIDNMKVGKDTINVLINVGSKFRWQAMGLENIPELMLSRVGYRTKDFENKVFSGKQFSRLINKLLAEATKTGHPFASFQLKDIIVRQNNLKATLYYSPGPVIYYDSLIIKPEGLVKPKFLESYLNIREGEIYNQKNVNNIPVAIKQLPFCRLSDSVKTSFYSNLCLIELKFEPVKANKVDALIGLLPNQQQGEGPVFTGFINLHLNNLFKSGKELSLIWRQFQKESQKLNFSYSHPNLLNSPFGLNFMLDLIKQDSSFLNTNLAWMAFYNKNKYKLLFNANFKTSRSLRNPAKPLQVPDVLDFNIQQLGIEISQNSLDNQLNPLRGSRLNLRVALGKKTILKNSYIDQAVYDSISINSLQNELGIGGEINKILLGPLVMHLDVDAGWIVNNSRLYTNDLLRLGGINSLRGFNDLDILVSSYMLFRFEPRLILNSTSRLFMFYDLGFTNNVVNNIRDTPQGFGTGLLLNTGAGELQLVYALGKSQEQEISFTQSRIHIGYVAHF